MDPIRKGDVLCRDCCCVVMWFRHACRARTPVAMCMTRGSFQAQCPNPQNPPLFALGGLELELESRKSRHRRFRFFSRSSPSPADSGLHLLVLVGTDDEVLGCWRSGCPGSGNLEIELTLLMRMLMMITCVLLLGPFLLVLMLNAATTTANCCPVAVATRATSSPSSTAAAAFPLSPAFAAAAANP